MSSFAQKSSAYAIALARTLAFLVYGVMALTTTVVSAQSTIDLDPPEIQHNVPAPVKAGKAVKISALVTDEGGVESVVLYYRTTQTGPYETADMQNSQGAEYMAMIATSKSKEGLQYYIEAVDTGGNRVLEGEPGSPLVVQTAKKSNVLLYAAGALLAIGLVAGAGGGGDENDPRFRDLVIQADIPSP